MSWFFCLFQSNSRTDVWCLCTIWACIHIKDSKGGKGQHFLIAWFQWSPLLVMQGSAKLGPLDSLSCDEIAVIGQNDIVTWTLELFTVLNST